MPKKAIVSLVAVLIVIGAVYGYRNRVRPVEEIAAETSSLEKLPEPTFGPDDWPWWRGPARNGVASGNAVPVKFSATENVIWKTPVSGRGHSSATVVGDKILLATADDADQVQSIVGFDRDTGKQVWKTDLYNGNFPSTSGMHPESSHATCTAACDGERAYVAFLNNGAIQAAAVDLDGKVVWERELGPFRPRFGYAPSPALAGSLVIFAADNEGGGYLAAVHRKSGKIVWRKQRPAVATYSSPVVMTVNGREQLLISGGLKVTSYDPQTGDELWSVDGTASGTCGTMIAEGDLAFASGGYPEAETLCVRADGSNDVLWRSREKAYVPSMLLHEQHLYLVDGEPGIAFCLDAKTGKQKWRARLNGKVRSSPVLCQDRIYLPNAAGKVFVFKANPEQFELLAENQMGDAESAEIYATPTICGGRMYLRAAEIVNGARQETLYCIGEAIEDNKQAANENWPPR
jgi:outer membrane protein assembly factor BamB